MKRPTHAIVLWLLWTGTSLAQSSQAEIDAKAHFAAGHSFYKSGDYRAAIGEFRAGYEKVPKPEFLLNLGQAHRRLGDFFTAEQYFNQFLREAPADHPERHDVENLLAEIANRPSNADLSIAARGESATAVTSGDPPSRSSPKRSLARRPLFWVVLTGAVAVMAGVVIGLAVTTDRDPTPTAGTVTVEN